MFEAISGNTRQRFPRSAARLCADVRAVTRTARPTSSLRWLARLALTSPVVAHSRSLLPADQAWQRRGAEFRSPSGRTIRLPGDYCPGARELYCRNVYLRTGLRIPAGGWVVDLGANAGLFTTLAAVEGARVLAVEAQARYAPVIDHVLRHNRIAPDQARVEVALVSAGVPAVALVGTLASAEQWRRASHAGPRPPTAVALTELLSRHRIDRVGLLKVDIEGSEFSLLHPAAPLGWLARVDQLAMEVHPQFGSVPGLVTVLRRHGLTVAVTDDAGAPVPAGASGASYLYARRDGP